MPVWQPLAEISQLGKATPIEPQPESGYTVTCPILPELITEGDTIAEALDNVKDALLAIVEAYQDLQRPLRHLVQQLGLDREAFKQT